MSRSDVIWCLALSIGLAVALGIGLALVGYDHDPAPSVTTDGAVYVGPGDGR